MIICFFITTLFVLLFQIGSHSNQFPLAAYGVVLLTIFFLYSIITEKTIKYKDIPLGGFLLLLCFMLTSIVNFISGSLSHTDLLLIFFTTVILLGVFKIYNNESNMILSFNIIMILSLPFALYLFYVNSISLGPIQLVLEKPWRLNSFFSISTTFGIYSSLSILLVIHYVIVYKKSVLWYFTIPVFLYSTNLSGARTGLIALCIVLFCMLFLIFLRSIFFKKHTLKSWFYVLLLLSIIPIGIILISDLHSYFTIKPGSSLDRLLTGDTNTLGGRTEKIAIGIHLFLNNDFFHMLFGSGSGSYNSSLHKFNGTSAHSGIIRIIYDYGLFSFLVLTLITICSYYRGVVVFLKNGNFKFIFYPSLILFFYICEFMIPTLMSLTLEFVIFIYCLYCIRRLSKKGA